MSTSVTLRGNLTRDPEIRYSAAGKPVVTFTVVTSRRSKNDTTGEWEDRDVSFWNCATFGQLAENAAESLAKGTGVIVQGNAAQQEWETKEGEKRRSLKVTVDDLAVSLRWHPAKVTRSADRPKDPAQQENPFRDDPPPF
jgi:single-strand DNA-binding protein